MPQHGCTHHMCVCVHHTYIQSYTLHRVAWPGYAVLSDVLDSYVLPRVHAYVLTQPYRGKGRVGKEYTHNQKGFHILLVPVQCALA